MTDQQKQTLDYKSYQIARRHMCWVAMGIMVASTIAVIVDPARMASADAQMMMIYGSLSALIVSFFAVGHKEV